ncbi:MAG: dethiobiotin synthase [Myxococcales bacterium]|nr:MAG: dethiobiotin synthase [Myxococcales bacterium]
MRVVMLGTGTDVGKTYVTALLARGLRAATSVLALKPIESGVADASALGDAGTIAEAAGHAARLSPWRLRRPVSPHLAAREQGVSLEIAEVVRWVQAAELSAPATFTLVETAGGAFSPLGLGTTNVELALALEPALWILVGPDALGVLHDVTATLRALPRAPDAVLLSGARPADQSTGSNAAELKALDICEVLETLSSGAQQATTTVQWLLDRMTKKSPQI